MQSRHRSSILSRSGTLSFEFRKYDRALQRCYDRRDFESRRERNPFPTRFVIADKRNKTRLSFRWIFDATRNDIKSWNTSFQSTRDTRINSIPRRRSNVTKEKTLHRYSPSRLGAINLPHRYLSPLQTAHAHQHRKEFHASRRDRRRTELYSRTN